MFRPAGVRRGRLRAVGRRRARGRRAGARRLRPRQAEICRPHRHRLHPRQRARRSIASSSRWREQEPPFEPLPTEERGVQQAGLGRAEAGGRGRFPRLDAWRPRAAGLVPGPARGQVGQGGGARGEGRAPPTTTSRRPNAAPSVKNAQCRHRRQGDAHPPRPRLLGGRRHHQARSCRLLQQGLEMDAAARRRPADLRWCAARRAPRANASSRSTRAPASRPSFSISCRRRATRSSPSTISTA